MRRARMRRFIGDVDAIRLTGVRTAQQDFQPAANHSSPEVYGLHPAMPPPLSQPVQSGVTVSGAGISHLVASASRAP